MYSSEKYLIIPKGEINVLSKIEEIIIIFIDKYSYSIIIEEIISNYYL